MAFSHWPCREVEVLEEEDVRGDRGLSVFRLRAVSRLTLVVRCTEISYSVSTQVLGFRFGCGWCCVVGFLFGCCWFCVLLLCVSAWWNRGILDEVTKASDGRAVTGTAVMARSANEEKKILTHLVAAQASVNPRFQHPAPVLGSFFKDLAHAVVHTILAPLNSQHMRPNLPPRVFTGEFWHAHFNYAALRTDPALAAIGSMDGPAGDQICQWNSVAPDSILPATHLSIFVPSDRHSCDGAFG